MERRRFLASLAGSAGLAGCVAAAPARRDADEAVPTLAESGFPPTICSEDVPAEAGVRGIAEPATAPDWSGIDVPPEWRSGETSRLTADSTVIGVTAGDRARAYPLRILHRLEVVNDDVGGPRLVTFCPLCNTGMVARRVVAGEPATFRLTGLLWRPPGIRAAASEDEERVFGGSWADPEAPVRRTGNLVMLDDRTGSYWSQFLARAICGPARGTELEILPARTTTWGDWRAANPGTDVLLPPPYSTPVEATVAGRGGD
jgi:hypothetical protein